MVEPVGFPPFSRDRHLYDSDGKTEAGLLVVVKLSLEPRNSERGPPITWRRAFYLEG